MFKVWNTFLITLKGVTCVQSVLLTMILKSNFLFLVVSNDALYGHDPKFLVEVNNLCGQVVDAILLQLKALGAAQQQRTQAQLSMELFLRIVRYADLSKEPLCQLAVKLWMLANKAQAQLDSETIVSVRSK